LWRLDIGPPVTLLPFPFIVFVCPVCRRAFQGLAYTKLDRVPLYLEWAPADSFTSPSGGASGAGAGAAHDAPSDPGAEEVYVTSHGALRRPSVVRVYLCFTSRFLWTCAHPIPMYLPGKA
jgi:hypothetical protein